MVAIACHYDIGSEPSHDPNGLGAVPEGGAPTFTPVGASAPARNAGAGTGGVPALAGTGGSSAATGRGGGGGAPVSLPDAGVKVTPKDAPDGANVVSFSPEANAANVDTHAQITISLDRSAQLADLAWVSLESEAGVKVPVTASVDGNTLTLTPDAPLDMQALFRLRLTSPLHGAVSTWTFTTADGVLHAAEDLFYAGPDPSETSRVIAASAAIRANTAVVAYRTVNEVAVRRSVHGSRTNTELSGDAGAPGHAPLSWNADEPVANAESDHLPATDTTAEIGAGIDAAGNVIVVWNAPVNATGPYSIFASRYTASTGRWSSPPDRLEHDTDACSPNSGNACGVTRPRVAVGADGNALVVWERLSLSAAAKSTVWAAPFAGGAWRAATTISAAGGSDAAVAVNGMGQGAAVWTEPGAAGSAAMRLRRFTSADSSWDAPRSLVFSAQASARTPFIGLNDQGTLLASWTDWQPGVTPQSGSGSTRTYWEDPNMSAMSSAGPGGQVNQEFRAALGAGDDVLAAWGEPNLNSVDAVARSLAGNDVWPVTVTIGASEEYVARVVPNVDARGRGLVAWMVGSDQAHPGIYCVRHDATLTRPWSAPVPLSSANAYALDAAMDSSGRALVSFILPDSGALQAVLFD